jgi:hypothetical protein
LVRNLTFAKSRSHGDGPLAEVERTPAAWHWKLTLINPQPTFPLATHGNSAPKGIVTSSK